MSPASPRTWRPRLRRDVVLVVCAVIAALVTLVGLLWSINGDRRGDAGAAADRAATAGEARSVDVLALDQLDDVDSLRELDGRRVAADDVRVQSVPADEGFWVDAGSRRVWVQITTAGESPEAVRAGQRVSFTGAVAAHDADFADRPEFSAGDAEALVEAGAHVEVDVGDLRITQQS